MHTMNDLDNINKYQLLSLEYYQGGSKEKIEANLFTEVAGWFLYYIRQALKHLNENELVSLIEETFQYPSFKLTGEYYLNRPELKRDTADLIRKAYACEYIRKVKEYNKLNLKDIILKIMRKIYVSI